jgi:very-short-patch-repair endonuclease
MRNAAQVTAPGRATERRVAAAAKGWRSSLINISGANRMLYYKDLRVGTLDLSDASQGGVSELLAMKTVRLSRLYPDPARVSAAGKSLKAISTRARVFAEEFGIHVTYVASGFASWPVTAPMPEADAPRAKATTPPRAPVLLRQVTVTPRPGSLDGFEITVDSEAQVNPVLLHLLEAQFGVEVDDVNLLERAGDDEAVFDLLTKTCAAALPGFEVAEGRVLGNFFYAEQPLVEDLSEDQAAFLATSDLIAALAGDDAASAAVRAAGQAVDDDAPDRCAPSDEYLILDADGSQSYVINAVSAGQNLVVQGPPGTGKSQTIANVIAELVARDKRVLFVAQKRAAITAVLRRLEQVNLDHLVLDLFQAGNSRRAVVAEVSRAVEQRKTTSRPRVDALHSRLEDNRDLLVHSQEAMHEVREPWNLALLGSYDADGPGTWGLYDWALETEAYRGSLRLDIKQLRTWSESTHEDLRAVVADFVATGGTDPALRDPGWSVQALNKPEAVTAADELLEQVADELLPTAREHLNELADELGVDPAESVTDVVALLDLGDRIQRLTAAGVGEALTPRFTDEQLTQQIHALGTRSERKAANASLGPLARRRLVKQTLSSFPAAAPNDLHDRLLEAQQLRSEWRLRSRHPAPPLPPQRCEDAKAHWHSYRLQADRLQAVVQGLTLIELSFDELSDTYARLAKDRFHRRYPRLHELRARLLAAGCGPLLHDFLTEPPADEDEAQARLSQAFSITVIDHIEKTDKRLFGNDSAVRDRASDTYVKADVEARQANAQRVRRVAAENLAAVLDDNPEQSEVLRDQLRRKRGFKPVRQLMSEAPDVLLAAKPVWAASPQTVSELLPAQQLFDVVLFDEASQIQPAAALPAIARGSQTVVAGDSLQLPPTTLFTRTIDALFDEEEALDADDDDGSVTGIVVRDMESILDAVETKLGPQRSRHLSWHYRSRDERLIATSNSWVYRPRGRQMTTFPAADGLLALQHVVVPPSSGVGPNNKSPQEEVRTVVDLVLRHAVEAPDASLGVIAFGIEHADRIQRELERRLADQPDDVRAWFTPTGDEPFFIKNIERVQGDERDKIILTVGYARGNDGQLRYSWGPVLQEGGHRRVNVAISRAKSHIVLVTSFNATDIDDRASDKEGFQLMRRFITFASTAGADFGDAGEQAVELNPFEYDILRRLEEAGLDVTPQYGVGSYRLDFAVRHPHEPGRFVLAVEADGAAYHSGLVARERDRLRQQALEARGWTFVRIWSTDYFRDPDTQIDRVLEAYNNVLEADPQATTTTTATKPEDARWVDEAVSRGPRPRVQAGFAIAQYEDRELDQMVDWVRSDDLPHTRDEVFEMVKAELGFQKNGKNIVARIYAAIDRNM